MSESKTTEKTRPILEVQGLTKYFDAAKGKKVHAVENVSFTLERGETLGIVGESGCGKSSMGRTILKIHDSTSGKIIFDGVDITKFSNKQMNPYRKRMQMIFQDPYASLNPRMTVGEIIEEPMVIHKMGTPKERKAIVQDLIQIVGLKPDHIRRYPFEFSGGQRQRIGIARALALNPEFIVCDEPISALDVSIQAQVINLLEKLQHERGFSYLFIAHDLEMVHHISHKIGVMYLGNMVEFGTSDEVYKTPLHPYTKALISASPVPDPQLAKTKKRILLEGEVPSPLNPPKGCPFAPRCPNCKERCKQEKPETYSIGNHKVACFLYAPEK
ncbi:MAG: ATP-binding cassette domain-containing protein [Treponema sp.]|nr:ATP-binding cassette domain-containing protein [Treponema sp.]MCI7566688.1 ATP-binding cassette domain-containing protein [Treponema sp.]